jgi:hypothetical protein
MFTSSRKSLQWKSKVEVSLRILPKQQLFHSMHNSIEQTTLKIEKLGVSLLWEITLRHFRERRRMLVNKATFLKQRFHKSSQSE